MKLQQYLMTSAAYNVHTTNSSMLSSKLHLFRLFRLYLILSLVCGWQFCFVDVIRNVLILTCVETFSQTLYFVNLIDFSRPTIFVLFFVVIWIVVPTKTKFNVIMKMKNQAIQLKFSNHFLPITAKFIELKMQVL